MKRRFPVIVGALGLTFLTWQCVEPEVVVTKDMRRTLDTLYRNERNMINAEQDSLCLHFQRDHYEAYLDSVLEIRQKERNKILQKQKK